MSRVEVRQQHTRYGSQLVISTAMLRRAAKELESSQREHFDTSAKCQCSDIGYDCSLTKGSFLLA